MRCSTSTSRSRKQAADAAKAHAKAIEALRDQLSGAALQADIKKLAQAWDGLTDAQKDSDAVLKRILPTLENYVQEGGKLPPILQKIYDEHRRANTAVADLTGGLRKRCRSSTTTRTRLECARRCAEVAAAGWAVAGDSANGAVRHGARGGGQ